MSWLKRPYVQDWMGYWSYLGESWTNRWATSMDQARARQYGPKEWLGDVVELWEDSASAWWSALNGRSGRPATVVFTIPRSIEGGVTRTVPVFKPSVPASDPRVIFRGQVDQPRHRVHGIALVSGSIDARWAPDGSGVEIFLKNLRGGSDGLLEVAAYEALVHVGDVPIAHVFVNVVE
jgi:hypothetical protein